MDPAVAIHVLFSQLDAAAKKIMVRKMFAMRSLYTDEELCDCIVLLPYPDELWYTIDRDVQPYLSMEQLWTDDESKWTEHLKPLLLSDLRRYKDAVYRYVLSVYPRTQVIPDLTYENVFAIIRKKKRRSGGPYHLHHAEIKRVHQYEKGRVPRHDGGAGDGRRR
jgi:hypothetical protein